MKANRQVAAWVVALVACAACSSSEGTAPPPGGVYGADSGNGGGNGNGDGGAGNGGDGSGGKGGKGSDGGSGSGSKDGSSDAKNKDGSKGDGSGGGNGDGSGGGNGDGSGGGGGGTDGPTDGPMVDHVLGLGACKGTSQSITVSNQLPYADLKVDGYTGEFGFDFGSTFSTIYLGAFTPPPGPATSGCTASELGQVCTVPDFTFFGTTASVKLTTENYQGLGGSVLQAGLIGTDLLSEQVFIIDYQGEKLYAAPSACTDSDLMAAGYVELNTTGFYSNDPGNLLPLSDTGVDASTGTVPNIPTVAVKVAGVNAFAQLDTGFDDDVTPYSVNINKAFYDAITSAQSGALVRDAAKDETLTTCATGPDGGVITETAEAYTLKSGVTFDFLQGNAMVARSYTNATLFVKDTPAAALVCGGISTWNVPAAQVGASFYVNMRSIIFDPFAPAVWMPQ